MNARTSILVSGLVIALSLLINLLLGGQTSGQQTVTPPATAGRYQVVVKANGTNSVVFVFDPATAECWYRDTNHAVKDWTSLGSPVIDAKP